MKFLNQLINWIFPKKCTVCGCEISEDAVFCAQCFSKVIFIDYPFCKCCGKMLSVATGSETLCETCIKYPREFDVCRSLFIYNKASKKLIMRIKKQACSDVAKTCVRMLLIRYSEIFKNADLIVPVPSHWLRTVKRGYNPSAIIAREVSRALKIPLQTNLLKRIRKTDYQKNKKIVQRIENVKGAFECTEDLSDKTIILVDDVFTTGATLNECAKTLKLAGAKTVLAITIAST